jgi:flagellar biogenesis protein FliO
VISLLLLLASAIPATPPSPDSQAVVAPAGRSDSASAQAAVVDSISASRLRAAQQAADKGGPSGAADSPASLSPVSLAHGLFQVVSGLAFLVLVAFGGLFVLHRVRRKTVSGQRGSLVDILETAPAGPGRQICLVRVHDRVVAVAFAASSVAPIAEFTGASAAEILADSGSGRTSVREFSATLDTFMERFRKPSTHEVLR